MKLYLGTGKLGPGKINAGDSRAIILTYKLSIKRFNYETDHVHLFKLVAGSGFRFSSRGKRRKAEHSLRYQR
jgi:hypothetical protein